VTARGKQSRGGRADAARAARDEHGARTIIGLRFPTGHVRPS
jgi:hypothetical protein